MAGGASLVKRVEVTAFAKVNLSLEVLGKRPDGFHELCTLMQSIGLADRLTMEEAEGLSLVCEPAGLGGEENLVLRAARTLREAHGSSRGARVTLMKGIPIAGGLGGASADAAAALVGLARLWGWDLPHAELAALAARLGSDVPFFLSSGTALARGRGEIVEPLPDLATRWLVLLVPSHSLPAKTAELYRRLRPDCWSSGERTSRLAQAIREGRPLQEDLLTNSFELVADQLFPSLAECRRALLDAGAPGAHLSGAGPALYALFPGESAARAASDRLCRAGYQPLVARTLKAEEARPRPVGV